MRSNMREKVKLLKNGLKIGAAVAAMALAVCVGNKSVAYAEDVSGDDGGIKWTIKDDTLTIEAKTDATDPGVMPDYPNLTTYGLDDGKAPWSTKTEYNNVRKIVIADGVKHIGDRAFGQLGGTAQRKELDKVIIGKDVESVGEYAFTNNRIKDLEIYTTKNVSYNETSFKSSEMGKEYDQGTAVYNIENLYCYAGFSEYFTDKNSSINVTNFNIKIESDNLLADKADVGIKWDGLSTSQTAQKATLSISPSQLALFTDKSMDLTKLKFFTLSQTDDNAPINKAKITIPTPSDWKDHHDNIKLYSYKISDNNTLTLNELAPEKISDDNIIFTGEGFPVNYVLYYNYNSNPEYKVLIDTQYFDNEVFYWGIAGGSLTYGIPTKTDTTISEIITKFVAANTANSSGYTFDNNKLKTFDLSLTADGTAVTTVPTNMRVKIPLPDGWDSADVQVLTLSSDGKIEVVNSITVTSIGSKLYVDFMPQHFSPYALYNAKAGTETTTATTTAAATTTTAVNTTTRANTVSTTNSNYNNNSTSYNGSGRYDNTPKTGVKDFMWIAIPVAVMLMGIGIVILGRRKQRSIDE